MQRRADWADYSSDGSGEQHLQHGDESLGIPPITFQFRLSHNLKDFAFQRQSLICLKMVLFNEVNHKIDKGLSNIIVKNYNNVCH